MQIVKIELNLFLNVREDRVEFDKSDLPAGRLAFEYLAVQMCNYPGFRLVATLDTRNNQPQSK